MSFLICCGILYICFPLFSHCQLENDFLYPVEINNEYSSLKGTNYSDYILPKNLKPTWYNLTLLPFLNNSTFRGWVTIMFDVINATDLIVINARFETIQNSSLKATVASETQPLNITNTTADPTHQMIWFTLNDTLRSQTGVSLSISYEGVLAEDMMGFYRSSYNTTDARGVQTTHLMAITQFESTFARRAFPCFDEPAYRANFTINIYREPVWTSMANMPLASSVMDSSLGMVLDTYQTSPSMPTYLVAFGVSDLANKSDGEHLRVFARRNVIDDANFTLLIGQLILNTIGNFTNVLYPLPKMDVVAVPDFSAGAMENWGLSTYREKYVLYNPKKNTWKDKFSVLSVVAHEFGHQWFGDLVTPDWWDYTWLNEAFATYFEYTTPDQLFPDWKMGSTMFVASAVQPALDSDVGSTRPMTSPVYTPDQIERIFDYVIYAKGGSVLRMIENFLTTPIWKDGLNRYLTENAYQTGTPYKLFSALEAAAYAWKSPYASRVVSVLTTWTTQPGFPLVKVHKIDNNMSFITQSPYELNTNDTDMRWSVPITYTTQGEAQFDASKASRMFLYTSSDTVAINTSGWVILNIDQVGYYRVNYEDENWSKLTNQLRSNFSVIGTNNRAQLLDDAFHLARTGHLNYSTALDLTHYLPQETDYAPWNAFFTNMRFLINQFYNTSVGDGLMQYSRDIMASPFRALTANLTNSASKFISSMTLLAAGQFSCDIKLFDCEVLASASFNSWQQNAYDYSLLPEARQVIICTGLRLDTTGKTFQTVLDYFLNSDNSAEKLTLINAMGCVTNDAAINTYLNVVCDVNANHVRLQDRSTVFRSLLSYQTGVTPVLQYLIQNYDKVSNALNGNIDPVFHALATRISQDTHIAQVKNIINDTTVDQRLRDKLDNTVLPSVVKRQAWAQSSQVGELKLWINNYLNSSSASSIPINLLLILAPAIFVILRL